MKKLALTLTATLACVAAFAQGKVSFSNDSLHLVYMTADTGSLLPTDVASAGLAAPSSIEANLTAALFAGTSSSSLSLQGTTTFGAIAGKWNIQNISTIPFGGTAGYFQVQIYATTAGDYATASKGQNLYYGESDIFTCVPATGASYPTIYNTSTTTGSSSTWAVGSYSIPGGSNKGAIMLQANVPEPTSLALLGLGAAGMMIFRRRK